MAEMNEEAILGTIDKFVSGTSPEETPQEPQQAADEETLTVPETSEAKVEVTEQPQETIELDPDEPLFEQEIHDGSKKVTQKLSLKELQNGYLRQQDYTRKTQELAKQRDELSRHHAKQTQDYSESYVKRLAELQQLTLKTVAADLEGVDWERLAIDDPLGYPAKFERRAKLERLLQTIQAEQKTQADQQAQENNHKKAQRWAESLEVLRRDIPDFGPDVAKRLVDAGKDWGFSPEEVSQWDDHRQIKMLHALMDKSSIESKRPEVEKKIALVTKTLKPGSKAPQRSQLDEAKARLKKTGKMEDALGVFNHLIR